MKLVLYTGNGLPHTKNHKAIQRMCNKMNIEYQEIHEYNQLKTEKYDILFSCSQFINPNDIPSHVKILFGPHFFIFPSGQIVGDLQDEYSKRCVYNVLSPWIKQLYLEFANSLIVPMIELPFGVDTDKFIPNTGSKSLDCIVYVKRRSTTLVTTVINILQSKNISFVLFQYGSYAEDNYLHQLNQSKFMIVLDAHESQGFALQEAMSSNTPLLVLDATSMYDEMDTNNNSIYEYLKPKKLEATSVPYWSDECGIKIKDINDIPESIDKMMSSYHIFTPRKYILETLSDEVCMKRILNYFSL
jgi:hypothetical protein